MSWIIYAIGAILVGSVSDLFRKLASNLKDPFFANLVFQIGASAMGVILYLLFSRKIETNPRGISYALIGGALIAIFTAFSFKALSTGPGVSTVIPIIRVGVVLVVVISGILLFREKLTWNIIAGTILASVGVYLLFLNK